MRYGRDGDAQRISSSRLTARQLLKLPLLPSQMDWFAVTSVVVAAGAGTENASNVAVTNVNIQYFIILSSHPPEDNLPMLELVCNQQHEDKLNELDTRVPREPPYGS